MVTVLAVSVALALVLLVAVLAMLLVLVAVLAALPESCNDMIFTKVRHAISFSRYLHLEKLFQGQKTGVLIYRLSQRNDYKGRSEVDISSSEILSLGLNARILDNKS